MIIVSARTAAETGMTLDEAVALAGMAHPGQLIVAIREVLGPPEPQPAPPLDTTAPAPAERLHGFDLAAGATSRTTGEPVASQPTVVPFDALAALRSTAERRGLRLTQDDSGHLTLWRGPAPLTRFAPPPDGLAAVAKHLELIE